MSTQINVTVESGGLTDRAKQQQLVARQAQLEKERTLNLNAEALDKRAAAQAAKGLSIDGQPLYSSNFKQLGIDRRPAANRGGVETWVLYYNSPLTLTQDIPPFGRFTHPYKVYNGRPEGDSLSQLTGVTAAYEFLPASGPFGQSAIALQQGHIFYAKRAIYSGGITGSVRTKSDSFCFEFDTYTYSAGATEVRGGIAGLGLSFLGDPGPPHYQTFYTFGLLIRPNISFRGNYDELQISFTRWDANPEDPGQNVEVQLLNEYSELPYGSITTSPGSWSQYAVTIQASTIQVFLDGALILSYELISPMASGIYYPDIDYYPFHGMITITPLGEFFSSTSQLFSTGLASALRFSCKARRTSSYTPSSLIRP